MIGGRSSADRTLDWPKVGRRRLEEGQAIRALAESLKKVREAKGITVAKLAKQLEIAPATIIKFEDKGHPISVGIVNSIAEVLGCALEVKVPSAGRKARR